MNFFSKLGNNIILPQDVLIQSKETNDIPGAINATIGIATSQKKAMNIAEISSAVKEISAFDYLPYSPTPGDNKLRNLWLKKIIKENKNLNEEYITLPIVTTGITQGIDITANLLSGDNDALLLPSLYWQNYAQIFQIKLNNNIYTYDQFDDNNNFSIENIKNKLNNIKENKIILLLNFPNNPTGYTPSKDEFNKLYIMIEDYLINNKGKELILLCDDAYFGLFFEENHNNSTLNSLADLANYKNCLLIKVDGITKELYSWGLRIGFITYYTSNKNLHKNLLEKTQGFIRSSTSSPSALAQEVIKKVLSENKYLEEKKKNDEIIKNRYNILKISLEENEIHNLVTILPFNSGYFFTIKLPENINAHEFRKLLLLEHKVGVYSMDDQHIRIAFSCLDEELIPDIIKLLKLCLIKFNKNYLI